MTRRSVGFWLGVAVAVLAVVLLLGGGATIGPDLDPDSSGQMGTRALVLTLEELGATVDDALPDDRHDVVLVLREPRDRAGRDRIEDFVERGGRAVLVAPSWLSPPPADFVGRSRLTRGRCDAEDMDGVTDDVEELAARNLETLSSGAGASCFGQQGEAFVVREDRGSGTIFHVADPDVFVNRHLGDADNAVLAARLFVPRAETRVAVVFERAADATDLGGEETLTDLVSDRVWWMMIQLLVAFAVLVWFHAKRFGGVVREPQLVEMPGSLLVQASGELRRRSNGHREAARRVREDFGMRLRLDLRLARESSDEFVAATVEQVAGIPSADVLMALCGPIGEGDAGLVELTRRIDAIDAHMTPSTPVGIDTKGRP